MKAGQKVLVKNLDYIDLNYNEGLEDLILGKELEYTGEVTIMEMYDNFDENDDIISERAYEFYYTDEDGDRNTINLFRDNFSINLAPKKKPANEIEFLDAFQRNFRE